VREEKKLASMASWFVNLLANLEFYSHLASWRVVIRTPASGNTWQKQIVLYLDV
jgi:hypothetical protein